MFKGPPIIFVLLIFVPLIFVSSLFVLHFCSTDLFALTPVVTTIQCERVLQQFLFHSLFVLLFFFHIFVPLWPFCTYICDHHHQMSKVNPTIFVLLTFCSTVFVLHFYSTDLFALYTCSSHHPMSKCPSTIFVPLFLFCIFVPLTFLHLHQWSPQNVKGSSNNFCSTDFCSTLFVLHFCSTDLFALVSAVPAITSLTVLQQFLFHCFCSAEFSFCFTFLFCWLFALTPVVTIT